MNWPNKLTVLRLILSVVVIILLVFPFYAIGIQFPQYNISGISSPVELQYLIAGVIFIIASVTDFLDGYIARKYDLITDTGKMLDAIADKVLVNSVLIIFAVQNVISPIIPVVIIFRDTIIDSIRMLASNKGVVIAAGKAGKIKTATMMTGLTLLFFYNLPFEIWNIDVANVLVIIATVLSIYSGVEYYYKNKKLIFENNQK